MSTLPEFSELGHHQVSNFLAGVNTELKCAALEATPTPPKETPANIKEVTDRVMIEANGGQFISVSAYNMGLMLSRMPEGLVNIEGRPVTSASVVSKTEDGELAVAFGGMILPPFLANNFPMRTLLSEHAKRDTTTETTMGHAIDVRLVVLGALYEMAIEGPAPSASIADVCATRGVAKATTRQHLRTLSATPIVERIDEKMGNVKAPKYMVAPDTKSLHPVVVLETYLENVAKFVARDEEALQKGRQFMHEET